MPRAFLVKGKADRKRAALFDEENLNRSSQVETDFSNQGSLESLTKVKASRSQISTTEFIGKDGSNSRAGKRIFSENEEFAASQRVFESTMDGAQSFYTHKTKENKPLKVVREEDGELERPTKKRRKQQQPYHKVVYLYPLSEQGQNQKSEQGSKNTPSVPHEMSHYANCYVDQDDDMQQLSIHKQTDSLCSPGSEITQPCVHYYAHHDYTRNQAQPQPRSRHNSDSRDESKKQLDFERLDRGLTEDELLEKKKEARIAREKQSAQYAAIVEPKIQSKDVAEKYNDVEQCTEEEVQPTVQYFPLETRPKPEYQRHKLHKVVAEEEDEDSRVPEITSVGVLRESTPTSPKRSMSSSHAPLPSPSAPSSYQKQNQAVQSYHQQPSYPAQFVTTSAYEQNPVYQPQLSPMTPSYPPQASPIAASYPPHSTAFGYPPHPKFATAAYPVPQASQPSPVYPPSSSPVAPLQSIQNYKHQNHASRKSHADVDTVQIESKRGEPYPPVTSPKVAQTPPIVHYVPVYAIQSPSGEQKYVAGPPINSPPADPSKVIPPPLSVLEKYPSAPSIPQAVQQNAIAYPSSYRVRVASDPGPVASVPPQQLPQFQQTAAQPLQVPQPQRYPGLQLHKQPFPPASHPYPLQLAQPPRPAQQMQQQPKPYQHPKQPLHYAPPLTDDKYRSKVYRVPEVCETARVVESEQSEPIQSQHIENHKKINQRPKKNFALEVVVPPNKSYEDIPSSPDSLCSNPSPSGTVQVKMEHSDNADSHLNGTSCVITPPGSPDDEESDSDGETYTVVMRDQGMQTIPVKGDGSKLAEKTKNTRQIYFNNNCVRKHDFEENILVKQNQTENIYVENSNLPTMAVMVPRPSRVTPLDHGTQPKEEERGVERYHCSFCNKGFQWHSHLKSHERTHTGEKPFKCSECGRCFTRADGLQCHMLVHNKKKPFKCEYCNKSFGESSQLEKHIYLHTGIKPFKCEYCGRAFSDSQSIEKHLLVHTGTKPYKCQYCVRSFNDSQMLVKHIRSHTGEKPFKCHNCTMAFSKQSALIIHNRVHTGEKPYQCPHCQKSFSISGNLQRHILIHTGERPYRCSKCPKAFNNPSHLSRHISKLHAPRSDDGPVSQAQGGVNSSEIEACEQ